MVRALSNRYHFYYRIRTTSGNGAISRIGSYNVGELAINVAYRKDLRAGSYSLTRAGRSPWGCCHLGSISPFPARMAIRPTC